MIKILIITDKFKGSLTSRQASTIISESLMSVNKSLKIEAREIADGGDGTIESIKSMSDRIIYVKTYDPLMRSIIVPIAIKDKCAFCEMAQSSGVLLLSADERNPMISSTYGFGVVLSKIFEMDIDKVVIGIGGSATNDVGVGMLSALGCRFFDSSNNIIDPLNISGKDLISIHKIDSTNLKFPNKKIELNVACDVNNPLYGPSGASFVFSYQKGADRSMAEQLEMGVIHFSKICNQHLGYDLSFKQGSGAAGGMGFALRSFFDAKLTPGWKLIFNILNIEESIKDAHLVITGEGRVDGQSLSGKLLHGVINLTEKYNKKLWVFCGSNMLSDRELIDNGIDRIFSISDLEPNKERAILNAQKYLHKISLKAATFLNEI